MLRKVVLGLIKKMKFLPEDIFMKAYYEYYTGKKLNLENPVDFNQKIQWYKLYYRPKILSQLVDKYEVRDYVKEKVGEQYLNELIGVYNRPNMINFSELPNKFVLKATHGYHFNILVNDKSQLNLTKTKLLLYKWLSKNQYKRGGLEWAYKYAKPRLIVEKYLEEIGKEDINDYKFFCFDGEPKLLHVDIDRGTEHSRAYYDMDWNKLPVYQERFGCIEGEVEQPENFQEMIAVVKKLAEGFPFVRVDLYNLNKTIIFGEMTFYPADGRMEFIPEEYNKIIGDYFTIPSIPDGQKYITTYP
ncbi:ATP-grasp fold amidoligase family protein [Allomuricauda sp. F6463D]|uniref:ATP-grasp fold amidoligase family protein n=1 Tax=Allomuricauda sp. F6463D TaxID=2926409 RepID=UPI001FF5B029|nr:ATP-grasp fold amidoligase family protein [Muricauda sp. F6463D]MCK0160272.1 glycosyltransferase [Muricauda sp. F6463D]